jgi:hypothetical protein
MKKYITVIAVIFAVGIAGCKKDYLSLESNPNQPSVTTPDLLLPSAQVGAASILATSYPHYGVWGGFWTTSGNYVPNPSINEYQITSGTGTAVWDNMYLNLSNWNTLEGLASTPALANYKAIAMIMKAYDFEQLVDNFNDVPYSQAFDPKNVTPAYDKGADVYHDLGKQLDAAIALITANPNATVPPTDVMLGGNMTAWQQFANTIKLRLAIRVYLKTPGDPLVTDLSTTKAIGYITADVTANPGYSQSNAGNGLSQESPFYGTYGFDVTGNGTFGNVYYRANAYAVKFYQNTNDPRDSAFYTKTSGGGIIQGNVFGDILNNQQNPNTSAIGPGLLVSATQPAVLFSLSEADFLQAEAIQSALIPVANTTFASAQAAYEGGITASFVSLGLTSAQAATYYGQSLNLVGWAATATSNKEQAIITQKWAALNGLFNLEAYNEYRRTGFPALPSTVDPSAIGHNLPTRILYPTSELSTNAANLGKEGTINPLTSKIFWAK